MRIHMNDVRLPIHCTSFYYHPTQYTTYQFWQMPMKKVFTPMPTIWLIVMLKKTKWS